MYLKTYLLLLLIPLVAYASTPEEPPQAKTSLGKVTGYHKKSAKRRLFSAFEGIPYAKPPIGELRFEPPEPIESWKGVWNASYLTECAQTGLVYNTKYSGEENCLFLNIYVPREKITPKEKLDVIVHIHGGLFSYGSGRSYSHPEYLMDEEVIFVTLNYRLNIFGFLSTEDNVVSGNMGLKDQVLALQWIQTHIESFGGNKNSVTLSGLSAGASSVHYHYLSDMSVGLFQKGFIQSGSATTSFALQEEPLKKANKLGELNGCPTTSTSVLVKCLKTRPYKHLLSKMSQFFDLHFLPVSPFAPVVEKGAKPFLNKNPYFLLAQGKIQHLPLLVSTSTDEGMFPTTFIVSDITKLDEEWNTTAPLLLDFKETVAPAAWNATAQAIRDYYFGKEPFTFNQLVRIVTDRFLFDIDSAIKLHAKASTKPVYYYQFGFPSNSSTNGTVSHGEDAQYFFYNMFETQPTPSEVSMKEVMIDMLVTYARTGKPVLLDFKWDPIKFPQINFLKVLSYEKDKITRETVTQIAPRTFWKSLGFLENQNLVLVKDEL